ncbi:hypothetical protein CSV75_01770 [Sporosarcina sp. P18a]|uniref:hypothetical protein n=1 Tax=Sporosarcina sp. P18a TaxID=2048259 RepID=UPI000C1641DD|nr:hypothetical protein [Sporosarcina sp. P18a]PIC80544.1 hypothetical protein CSV75_01770 [Sporosarcina sp. P18a]
MTEKKQEMEEQVVQEVVKNESNPLVIVMPIKKELAFDGKRINELKLDFSDITGADILSVDNEMRIEGHPAGFDNIYNQEVLLKLSSRVTGILPDELQKLHAADFLEMVLQVRNFFIRW